MSEKQIHVYYHVCLKNDGLLIAVEQLHLLSLSGLMYHAKSINIGVKYSNIDDKDRFIHLVNQYNLMDNINILYCEDNYNNNNHELSTAIHLKNYADSLANDIDDYIFYFHTKGVTHYKTKNESAIKHWRHYMEYFTIQNWKECVNKLKDGYESCGTFVYDIIHMQKWITDFTKNKTEIAVTPNTNRYFYPGTFYWMNTSIIKKIPIKYFEPNTEWLKWSIEILPALVEHEFYAFSCPNPPDMIIGNIVLHPLQYMS